MQRSGNRVRVTAQLIDARTDTHLWAERYDRDLADVFAIQSEIAQKISAQLQAVLSPREEAAMQAKPTSNMVAFDLYLRGKEIDRNGGRNTRARWTEALGLFEQAVAQDPRFVPALCLLARAHIAFYWFNFDHTESRIAAASKALEAAAALQPDAAEVRVTRALLRYQGYLDYAGAIAELEAARRVLPNDADVLLALALVERRQGRWEEAIGHSAAALALDPRNLSIVALMGEAYTATRQYGDAARVLDGALSWQPNEFDLKWRRATVDFDGKADLRRMREALSAPVASGDNPEELARAQIELGLLERDFARARDVLSAYNALTFSAARNVTPRGWFEGLVALGLGDKGKTEAAFLSAREAAAAMVASRPDDAHALMTVAEIDARLGRKEIAVNEAERARKLLPLDKDAFAGPQIERRTAGVYAHIGEIGRALDLLEERARHPAGPSYGALRLDQVWEPLRAELRFQKLLASLAPSQAKQAGR